MRRDKDKDEQNVSSLNHFNVPAPETKKPKNYREKYQLDANLTNRYSAWASNPTVQPDSKTEMGVPVPDEMNTEFSKEYQEENKL